MSNIKSTSNSTNLIILVVHKSFLFWALNFQPMFDISSFARLSVCRIAASLVCSVLGVAHCLEIPRNDHLNWT